MHLANRANDSVARMWRYGEHDDDEDSYWSGTRTPHCALQPFRHSSQKFPVVQMASSESLRLLLPTSFVQTPFLVSIQMASSRRKSLNHLQSRTSHQPCHHTPHPPVNPAPLPRVPPTATPHWTPLRQPTRRLVSFDHHLFHLPS
jgi:hypothetical protein